MVHIKKLVIQGFKSFAKKTEVDFDKGINLFVGPNGSGKTNVADSILFVLGRLSAKSMRASQAKNLIFMGSKYVKPAKEAYVELIMDNTDRAFSIDKDEIGLKRIVRANGQSIYKINDDTKTRTEVLEMLAQGGIDPYGFNLVLQGQIQGIVRMHSQERRKIIEEVAGISIYESRKEKSMHELEKTEERLKEISTILRERTSYLRNLEKEKAQAEKFKNAEFIIKRAKASILSKKVEEKAKELNNIIKSVEEKDKIKDKIRTDIEKAQTELENLGKEVNDINKSIQKATGLEQEKLNDEIANLKAEIEGLKVRKESYENRSREIENRIEQISNSIPDLEAEIESLRRESPLVAKKSVELKKKKEDLNNIEGERKKLLVIKTEIQAIREKIRDREKRLARTQAHSESVLKRIEEYSGELKYGSESECAKRIEELKKEIFAKKNKIIELRKEELENERIISASDNSINHSEKIKSDIEKIDTCPICQTKISNEHKDHVHNYSNERISGAKIEKNKAITKVIEIEKENRKLADEILELERNLSRSEIELINQKNIREKKEELRRIVDEEKLLKKEIIDLENKKRALEAKSSEIDNIEEQYHKKMLEIEEISSRTSEDIDTTLLYKERELENVHNIIKRSKKDIEDLGTEISDISEKLQDKLEMLGSKAEQETKLQEQFKKMFEKRDSKQKLIGEKSFDLSESQQGLRQIEEQVNYLKIGKAKFDAEKEALEMELSEYSGIELLQGNIASFEDRLKRAQESIQNIGSINMKALEVYDEVKKEYDIVQEKVNILDKEKNDILMIIENIDKKKVKTFMNTFKAINELFTSNFSKLSSKGTAYLEIQNKEDIFSEGIDIIVRLAKGKYFDVTSLSGGEQTLVALSLLFAIQEYKPYHFYVFDEIDAALDKRNSERLSGLLNQYMKSGQYIVITHNDAIISNSDVLYGVTMHEGVSKILSLRIDQNSQPQSELTSSDDSIKSN